MAENAIVMGEAHLLHWYVLVKQGGKDAALVVGDRKIVTIPLILWPDLGGYRAQVELTRLLISILCGRAQRDRVSGICEPDLIDDNVIRQSGAERIIWNYDYVCTHCGAVNWQGCCADSPHKNGDEIPSQPRLDIVESEKNCE